MQGTKALFLSIVLLLGLVKKPSFASLGCVSKDDDLTATSGCSSSTCADSCSSVSFRRSADAAAVDRRVFDLIRSTKMGAANEPAKTRALSKELWTLAFHMPKSWNRIAAEKNALVPLSKIDPELSMNLLWKVEDPVSDIGGDFPEDVRADAAREIFANYWRLVGSQGLPGIEALARHFGDTGEYPYGAISIILKKSWKPQGDEVNVWGNRVFAEAVKYYQRGSKYLNRDEEFLELLQNAMTMMPRSQYQDALKIFVTRLTNRLPADKHYFAEIGTSNGFVRFTDQNRALLFLSFPLIREIDSLWAEQLAKQYPELERAIGPAVYAASGVVRGNPGVDQLVFLQNEVRQRALNHALEKLRQDNPQAAIQLAQRLANLNDNPQMLSFVPPAKTH